MSDAHSTTLWLDHFICNYDLHTRVVEMQILEKNPSSDQLPVYAKFTLDIGSTIYNSSNVSVGDESIPFVKYQWAKVSDSDIKEYRQGTYRKLSHTVVPTAIYCKDALCKDCEHRHQIEEYYDNMCNALSSISKLTFPTCRFRCSQEFIVPGFNEHLKKLHGKARECYLVWKDAGRPRTGDAHNDMRVS